MAATWRAATLRRAGWKVVRIWEHELAEARSQKSGVRSQKKATSRVVQRILEKLSVERFSALFAFFAVQFFRLREGLFAGLASSCKAAAKGRSFSNSDPVIA